MTCTDDTKELVADIKRMVVGGTKLASVSCVGQLDSGELLAGPPTVTQTDSDPDAADALTLTNKAVSTAVLTINDASVPIGKAIQFKVVAPSSLPAGVTEARYRLKVSCTTDSDPVETASGYVDILVADYGTLDSED